MLFACAIWGHAFGVQFSVQDGIRGSVGKLGVLFHSVLRWAISVPAHIRGAALYLLAHTIPLHGLVVKQMVRYFGQLEGERRIY